MDTVNDTPPGYEGLLNLSYKFLAFRPRSEHEMRTFLRKKHAQRQTEEKIIAVLQHLNYINDLEFGSWWIKQRAAFRPKGTRLLKLELKQKGVPIDVIESLFATEKPSQKDMAAKLIGKYLPKYEKLPKREVYQKLQGILARRGFDWETIKSSIDDALKERV
jgi:regulatory protein